MIKQLFKKSLFVGVLLSAVFTFSAKATNSIQSTRTYVPDDNFERYLIRLGLDSGVLDNYVDTDKINKLTRLNLSSLSISDATGLQDFIALESLDISKNNLTSLNVSKNIKLKELVCANNRLSNLDVSALVDLTILNCSYNGLTSLNTSANTKLTQVTVFFTAITALDFTKNPSLTSLEINNNRLTSLDISKNPLLKSLEVRENAITAINFSNNPELTFFSAASNKLTTLDFSSNPKLTTAFIGVNNLTEVNLRNGNTTGINLSIAQNPSLTKVNVDDAALSNTQWKQVIPATVQVTTIPANTNGGPVVVNPDPVVTTPVFVYVKRVDSSKAPKIHAWYQKNGVETSITNSSNWPSNLPTAQIDTDGWYKFAINQDNYGVLFLYDDVKTVDFKFYTGNRWITLDAKGALKSIATSKPAVVVVTDPIVVIPDPIITTPDLTYVYVKREGSSKAPKIHAWYTKNGVDTPLTNTANWPSNLPTTQTDTDGWFKFAISQANYGVLFIYEDVKTVDFKSYTGNQWIVLDVNGAFKSISATRPTSTPITTTPVSRIKIYAKDGTNRVPKIHVWSNSKGNITNATNWPVNLPTMTLSTDGYYVYEVPSDQKDLNCLFIFGTDKTVDQRGATSDKYYSFNAGQYNVSLRGAADSEIPSQLVVATSPDSNSIQLQYPFTDQTIQVGIYRISGQLMLTKTINSQSEMNQLVNTSALTNGVYIVKLQEGSHQETVKIYLSK